MPTGMRNSKFQVTVSLLSGRSLQVMCCRACFVEELKKTLTEQTPMLGFGQRLYYKGRELQNSWTLATAGIRRNAELMLVFDEDQPPGLVDDSSSDDR